MEIKEEVLLEQFIGQEWLCSAIDTILDRNFYFQPLKKNRIRRGVVHKLIAQELKAVLNNSLCKIISERVVLKGGKPYICNAKRYYKHVVFS